MSEERMGMASCLDEDQSGRPGPSVEEGIAERAADPRFVPLSEEQAAQLLSSTDSTILPPEPQIDVQERSATRPLAPPAITRVFQGRAASALVRANSDIDTIVIHTPEGNPQATLSVLSGTRASFDFYMPLSGELYRCNDYRNTVAWHAGDWEYNRRSVGIEQGDFAANAGNFPEEHYRRLAYLVAYLCQTFGIEPKYATQYGEGGIIDHRTITPNRRVDPGPGFKRQHLIELVKAYLNGDEQSPAASSGGITWVRGQLTAGPGALARREFKRGENILRRLEEGKTYSTDGYTDNGEQVNGLSRWYHLSEASGYGWVHASGGTYSEG